MGAVPYAVDPKESDPRVPAPEGVVAGDIGQVHAAPASAWVKASASDVAWAGHAARVLRDGEEDMS